MAVPEASGFALALDRYLAQGGNRQSRGGASRARSGMRYTEGPLKGMTRDQAVEKARTMWFKASPAVRDKYAMLSREGMLAGSEASGGRYAGPVTAEHDAVRTAVPGDRNGNGIPDAAETDPDEILWGDPLATASSGTSWPQDRPESRAIQKSRATNKTNAADPAEYNRHVQEGRKTYGESSQYMDSMGMPQFTFPGADNRTVSTDRPKNPGVVAPPPPTPAYAGPAAVPPPVTALPTQAATAKPVVAPPAVATPQNLPDEVLGPNSPGEGYTQVGLRGTRGEDGKPGPSNKVWRKGAVGSTRPVPAGYDPTEASRYSGPAIPHRQRDWMKPARAKSGAKAPAAEDTVPEVSFDPETGYVPKARPVAESVSYGQYDQARGNWKAGPTGATDPNLATMRAFREQEEARKRRTGPDYQSNRPRIR